LQSHLYIVIKAQENNAHFARHTQQKHSRKEFVCRSKNKKVWHGRKAIVCSRTQNKIKKDCVCGTKNKHMHERMAIMCRKEHRTNRFAQTPK
jgi:hypothetical protein